MVSVYLYKYLYLPNFSSFALINEMQPNRQTNNQAAQKIILR